MVSSVMLRAQDGDAHWAIQGGAAWAKVPSGIVEQTNLPEVPDVTGMLFQVGLARMNSRGAPSFAFLYSQADADIEGSLVSGANRASLTGSGTMRGVMVTRYWNFVTTPRFSFGLATGGGIGRGEGDYTRAVTTDGTVRFTDTRRFEYTIPQFETLIQSNIRLARYLSLAPYFGFQNGFLTAGGYVRFHLVR